MIRERYFIWKPKYDDVVRALYKRVMNFEIENHPHMTLFGRYLYGPVDLSVEREWKLKQYLGKIVKIKKKKPLLSKRDRFQGIPRKIKYLLWNDKHNDEVREAYQTITKKFIQQRPWKNRHTLMTLISLTKEEETDLKITLKGKIKVTEKIPLFWKGAPKKT